MTFRFAPPAAALLGVLVVSITYQSLRSPLIASEAGQADTPAAPMRLSETGLFSPGSAEIIARENRPFSPQYPLWSDGAIKRRWIYLPPGTTIDATDVNEWVFPVGSRLWKEFVFAGRRVETRMLWKASHDSWIAATYRWNDDQNEAFLAPEEGVPGVLEVARGRRHSIPARADCGTCHGSRNEPIGFNALQLSTDRDPGAIHGETLLPDMVTLKTLVDEGLLSPARKELLASPPRIRSSNARTRAILGYFATNCGVCHNRNADIAANLPSLAPIDVMADGDAVARSLMERATAWQAPAAARGATTLAIDVAHPDSSAVLARMRSRRPSSQMPPLATSVADEAAIAAVSEWIAIDLARLNATARR